MTKNICILGLLLLAACSGNNNSSTTAPQSSNPNNIQPTDEIKVNSDLQTISNKLEVSFKRKYPVTSNSLIEDLIENQSRYIISFKALDLVNLNSNTVKCFDITNKAELPSKIAESNFADGSEADLEINLSQARTYSNEIRCDLINKEGDILKSFTNILYKDVVVTEETAFNNLNPGLVAGENKIGALILKSSGTLYLNGTSVQLNATDVFAERGSLITTFIKSQKNIDAKENQAGLSGGSITLNTRNAVGELDVLMIGQNSGRQTQKPETNKDLSQAPIISYFGESNSCPGAKEGASGLDGLQGFTGFNGGDSGTFEFNFIGSKFNNSLSINYDSIPGKAGLAGPGGDPGKGSPGEIVNFFYYQNDGSESSCDRHCLSHMSKVASSCQGHTGRNGNPGPMGKAGLDGKTGKYKLILSYEDNNAIK